MTNEWKRTILIHIYIYSIYKFYNVYTALIDMAVVVVRRRSKPVLSNLPSFEKPSIGRCNILEGSTISTFLKH